MRMEEAASGIDCQETKLHKVLEEIREKEKAATDARSLEDQPKMSTWFSNPNQSLISKVTKKRVGFNLKIFVFALLKTVYCRAVRNPGRIRRLPRFLVFSAGRMGDPSLLPKLSLPHSSRIAGYMQKNWQQPNKLQSKNEKDY